MSDMPKEEFTRGRWAFVSNPLNGKQLVAPRHNPSYVIAEMSDIDETGDEERANGDLIRASPELLRALKSLLSDEHARDLSIYYADDNVAESMRWGYTDKEEASARIADREDAAWKAVQAAHGIIGEEEED